MKITEVLRLMELDEIPIKYKPWKPEQEYNEVKPRDGKKSSGHDIEKYNKTVAKSMEKVNNPVNSGLPYKELKSAIVGMIKDTVRNKDTATLTKILNLVVGKFKSDQQEELYVEISKLKGWGEE